MTDQEIISHIREGQRTKAFTRLYRYFPKIKSLIKQYGGNADDAQDVFQETLIVFCRKCSDPQFVLTSSIDTYLYSVARFVWSDELKKRKKMPPSELSASLSEETNEPAENEGKFKLAEAAFEKLGDKCKELLQLFYIAKLNMVQIAEKLGYSTEQSARNQKYKCLEHSREVYRQLLANQDGRAAL